MELRELSIETLNPAPYNPRRGLKAGDRGYERLARSIEEFDLVQPIVWNERTGHVVAGHQWLAIARSRGMASVPCVVVNLSLNREKALNVALNNPAVGSDWDGDRLRDVLVELQEAPDVDATLSGFDADELRDLLLRPVALSASEDSPAPEDERMRVTLMISSAAWEGVRRPLDRLARRDGVEMHVKSER